MVKAFRAAMDAGKHTVDPVLTNFKSKYAVDWAPFLGKKWTDAADTALPLAEIKRLAERITSVPASFKVHPLVEKVLADRAAMGRGEVNVDWGMGEHLAFASLVASGYAVRLSGEDCGRGTFTHRHAVLHDQNREKWDEGTYWPLAHIQEKQGWFHCFDSVLSDAAPKLTGIRATDRAREEAPHPERVVQLGLHRTQIAHRDVGIEAIEPARRVRWHGAVYGVRGVHTSAPSSIMA